MDNRDRRKSSLSRDRAWSTVGTILILDNDLGFLFWLGQALTASHCKAFPATSITEAVSLIAQFKLKIDLLIMNPAVPGAADFMRSLRREQRHLRVAVMTAETHEEPGQATDLVPVLERKI
jgi:DNA-binding response OmpR family regulator